MSIRKVSKLRIAAVCTAGAMAFTACSVMSKQSPTGNAAEVRASPRSYAVADDAQWDSAQAKEQPADPAEQSPPPVVVTAQPSTPPMPAKKVADARVGALGGLGASGGGAGLGLGVGRSRAPGPKREAMMVPPQRDLPVSSGEQDRGAESGNSYDHHRPNPWIATAEDRFSTFAADVDTASYTQARRFLTSSVVPPAASVRVEEFVNYFNYAYAPPKQGAFTVHLEAAPSPFTPGRHLVKVGIKGKVLAKAERKPAHLVFLVDTSGSMGPEDRLPLAKEALKVMVDNLNENDTVALVTYAGSVRDVLPPTPATDRRKIFAALEELSSGGGTSMGSGVELAYKHAVRNVSSRAVSRVVVLTDGDTNIGRNQTADQMLGSIKSHVDEGVTLTMVGFGMGNYRDSLMEKLADAGNGNCYYIDSMKEAKRVFQEKLAGTLEVIAKDVKLQVEFHPDAVTAYRLVGYENRDIADRDFRNDRVDAGEIGAGHTVTALYEVQLAQGAAEKLATVRIRAKEPSGTTAAEQAFSFGRGQVRESFEEATADFRFASAVAGTADILRGNPQTEGWSLATAEEIARSSAGDQPDRQEFVRLVQRARALLGDAAVAAK